jgi:hypothetical protein
MRPLLIRKAALLVVGVVAVLGTASLAFGQTTIELGTAGNASQFLITGAGASGATAYQEGNSISLTSTADRSGTFVTGGSLASFNGLWYADETFTIPAGATGVTFTYSGLAGDDRVALLLNGTTLSSVGVSGATGICTFLFPSGPVANYSLSGVTSGTVTTGLNIGGTNTLRLVVNNTGGLGATAATAGFSPEEDGTNATLAATVTYTLPVTPLAPSVWFLLTAIVLFGAFQVSRKCLA